MKEPRLPETFIEAFQRLGETLNELGIAYRKALNSDLGAIHKLIKQLRKKHEDFRK